MEKRALGITYIIALLVLVYAPMATMAVFSFNRSKSRGAWGGFTFNWYKTLFHNETVLSAITVTFVVALAAAVISTIIGTIAAIGIYHAGSAFRKVSMSLIYMPMMNSEIVTGISLMMMFTLFGLSLGFQTLLMSHITFCLPYVVLSVLPKLYKVNASVFEAARDLGASIFYAYRKIVIPDIMPGIITGFLLSITLSIDDFMISFFNTGEGVQTISIYVYTSTKRGIKPEINALSTLMLLGVLVLLFVINRKALRNKEQSPLL
jgi:spermidine/putrescine transport system permease protein